jgi:hypothetical protein
VAGQEEILDQGACCREGEGEDLLGRRLVLGGREVGRGGLYRRVVLLAVSVINWEQVIGIWRVWTYE